MNDEIKKCRQHYESLQYSIRMRTTAQWLLRAIKIAEQQAIALKSIRLKLDADNEESHRADDPEGAMDACYAIAENAVSSVTKEGE